MDAGGMEQDNPIHLPTQSHSPPILLDSIFLLFLRLVYFLLARRFLSSTINPTLREISKPETLLPPTSSSSPSLHTQTTLPSRASPTINAGYFELEVDTEDDGLSGTLSPNPSYPPTPNGTTMVLPSAGSSIVNAPNRAPYRAEPIFSPTSERVNPANRLGSPDNNNVIELGNITQKLKDAGRKVQVLQLSHGKSSTSTSGGTKKIKRATKGLNRMSRVLFSLCVAEGCNVLTLVMFHALGILHSRSRHVNFSVSLHILLAMILFIVPLVQCLLFTYRSRSSNTNTSSTTTTVSSLSMTARLLISLIPFSFYIFLFTRIPPYITAVPTMIGPSPLDDMDQEVESLPVTSWTEGPEGWEGGGWLAPSLGRVVVLGVVVLGALSGFGAVRTAWTFMDNIATSAKGALTDHDIIQAERSLYRVRHDLQAKREEMNRLNANEQPSGSGWMGRVFGSKADQEAAALQAELSGLLAMEKQVSRSISAMKMRKKRHQFGQTLQGKLYNIIGYIFAFYCAARVLMALPSLFFSPTPPDEVQQEPHQGNTNGDWISFLVALGIAQLPTGTIDIDVAVCSRGISLFLTGLLILSSLAQVLRSLSRVLKLTSKTVGAGFLLLSLGQLFSTYVISLLVQLRTTLPPSPATDTDPFSPFYSNSTDAVIASGLEEIDATRVDDSLLSTLPDFRVFGRLFDIVFLLAAFSTALYRYISSKVNSADDNPEIYQH